MVFYVNLLKLQPYHLYLGYWLVFERQECHLGNRATLIEGKQFVIPFLDLKAQYQQMKREIDTAISRVVESAHFVLGPEVTAFEERFAKYCDVKHCSALNSGTSALHLALLAAGIGPGDEVITVSMTFVATTAAILYCGAKPVFVDVDPAPGQ